MVNTNGPNPELPRWEEISHHKGVPPKTDDSVSSPSLHLRPCATFESALTKGYHVVLKRGTNRYRLFQYLLSKSLYSSDGLHVDDYLVMFDIYFQMIDSKDPNFQNRVIELSNESLINVLRHFRGIKVFPYHPKDVSREHLRSLPMILHPNAFFGIEGQGTYRNSYRLSLHALLIPRRITPKAYIGVGYKDKGSRREPALDGSPSWQEVATHSANQERESQELPGLPPISSEGEA